MKLRNKKTWLWLLPLLLLLALLAYWLQTRTPQTSLPSGIQPSLGQLRQQVAASGSLQPLNHVDVGAQISGQLIRLHVEVGDQVTQGQLLAEIDARVMAANVEASRAQLRAQAAQMQDREAQLVLARLAYERQQRLWADRATSEEALQQAEASLKSAEAQLVVLQAQIDQNQSSLQADEANLEHARILAPMDGTVVSITARQGQTLNANQQAPTILSLADLSVMTVVAKVSEADVTQLREGLSAYFTTLGQADKRWQGQLKRIEPTPVIENNVVLYNVLFDVNNDDGLLLPNMTAQVFFTVAESEPDSLLIPMGAVQTRNNRHFVQRILPDGRTEEREVQLGINNRIQTVVTAGLTGEDTILPSAAASANASRAPSGGTGMPRMPR